VAKPPKKMSLRKLASSQISNADIQAVMAEIRQASDRTAGIVLASWVERTLEQSFAVALPRHDEATMEKLMEQNGALGSFYSKIHLGYALSLYDEVARDNLDAIRVIRNAFAHAAVPITFETEQVAEQVRKIRLRTFEIASGVEGLSENRKKFTGACGMFVAVSKLQAAASKMEFMKTALETFAPYMKEDKRLSPAAAEQIAKAVDQIRKLKID
jgi:hypothetical protein